MTIPRTLTCLLALALLGTNLRADVLVVRSDGAGDFTSLVDAVNAAQDGDIVLVQSDYAQEVVNIDGKSLTLLSVLGLQDTQSVTLRGLEVGPHALSFFAGASLAVHSSDGAVLVEDCHVQGTGGLNDTNPHGLRGLLVADSPGVLLTRSTVVGGAGISANDEPFPFGFFTAGDGGAAVHIQNGALNVYDSVILGGNGGSDVFDAEPGGNGGAALSGSDARVWFEGGFANGGFGGGGCLSAHDGCAGGPGIALQLNDPLFLRDATVSGGSAASFERLAHI